MKQRGDPSRGQLRAPNDRAKPGFLEGKADTDQQAARCPPGTFNRCSRAGAASQIAHRTGCAGITTISGPARKKRQMINQLITVLGAPSHAEYDKERSPMPTSL